MKRTEHAPVSIDQVVQFILRENCPDCFHDECLRRVDLVIALQDVEHRDPRGNR